MLDNTLPPSTAPPPPPKGGGGKDHYDSKQMKNKIYQINTYKILQYHIGDMDNIQFPNFGAVMI